MPDFPIIIRLAGEPQGKGRPRFARATGRAFTPAKTRSYEACLRMAAQDAMNDRAPVDCAIFVTVTAAMPVPASWSGKKRKAALNGEIWPTTKPDADNFAKGCDALNEVVFRDDKQIVALTVVKTYSARPELKIVVREAVQSAATMRVAETRTPEDKPPPFEIGQGAPGDIGLSTGAPTGGLPA